MTQPIDIARCRGDGADECRTCARREAAQQAPDWRAWWIVPPVRRPCVQRIKIEVRDDAAVAR